MQSYGKQKETCTSQEHAEGCQGGEGAKRVPLGGSTRLTVTEHTRHGSQRPDTGSTANGVARLPYVDSRG